MGKSKVKRLCLLENREPKQPRRRRQQKPHKFAYLTMENSIFARFARAFFIFWQLKTCSFFLGDEMTCFAFVWTTWAYDDKCSVLSYIPSAGSDLRIVRTQFSSRMTLNNWKMIAETRSYIFRWRCCFRRRRLCLSTLILLKSSSSILYETVQTEDKSRWVKFICVFQRRERTFFLQLNVSLELDIQ